MLQKNIGTLKKWIENSKSTVFFGGAGVSTESGIPDFRSTDGIYHMKYDYPPEVILSHSFFIEKTTEFYEFYRDKMIYEKAKPNLTHYTLAKLEAEGMLSGVITQNIDGLHQRAGSRKVLELHGSVHQNHCMLCHKYYPISIIMETDGVPYCNCGGVIKPDVVLYEEGLDNQILSKAIELISNAEVLIIGGTSLSVYPAAGLIGYYRGSKMVLINKSVTQFDKDADLLIKAILGDVFSVIQQNNKIV